MAKLKLTKAAVERVPLTKKGQEVYWDTDMKGFGLLVGMNTKSFVVQTNIQGKAVRVTLGQFGLHSVDEYRDRARRQIGAMKDGIDPREEAKREIREKRAEEARSVTLDTVFTEFKKAKASKLKEYTLKDYEGVMRRNFKDWLETPLKDITTAMVRERHSKIQADIAERHKDDKKYENRGEAHANGSMRVFRAVYNYALETYEDAGLPANPVRLKKNWFKDVRRQTIVTIHQLPAWYKAVSELSDILNPEAAATTRDWLLLLLFTGLRRMEGAGLTWDRVDFVGKTLTVSETKNGEVLTLPLPQHIHDMLKARKDAAGENAFVFPWPSVKEGHIIYPVRYLEEIQAASGVMFSPHDLRRTFITTAESLDLSAYTVKRLVNHKTSGVTEGYIITNVERLRKPMEQIADYLLSAAGVKPKAQVISLDESRAAIASQSTDSAPSFLLTSDGSAALSIQG
ncbi:MAG: phage related integrase [Rhodocyclaceae bacterium]|nr:MAG: phage related integrase [Rhodocyclaceae bacterium]